MVYVMGDAAYFDFVYTVIIEMLRTENENIFLK